MSDTSRRSKLEQATSHQAKKRLKVLLCNVLKMSSSLCALTGGILLASRIEVSGHGFIFLAMSSSQLLGVSIWERDISMIIYAGSVFLFVDCFGVYRWLIA